MMKFIDGPAAGQVLALHRTPILIRAVVNSKGKWDALDQLSDTPSADERIFLYILAEKPMPVHINAKKGGGWYGIGTYAYVPEQPSDTDMRDRWQEWCDENEERLMPAWIKKAGGT